MPVSNGAAGEMRAGAGEGRIASKGTLLWEGNLSDLVGLDWMPLLAVPMGPLYT